MTRTGFRKLSLFSYSLQRTSLDFENNRKTMLTEKRISHYYSAGYMSQPSPYAQKSQPAAIVTHREQQETTTQSGSEFEYQIF